MINVIKENLYRINKYGAGNDVFVEASTKIELYKFIIEEEKKGSIITSVNLIEPYGKSTPIVAFKNDIEYKKLKNEMQ